MKLKKFLSTSSFILMSTAAFAASGDPYDTVVMCRACPAGYVGNGSGTECTACAGGTYQNQTGQSSCITCNAGTYSGAKASSCTQCPAGTYSSAGASSCSTCPAGKYSGAGASSCSTCPAGTYSGAGASSCTPCPDGKYQPSTGQSSCLTCSNSSQSCSYTGSCWENNGCRDTGCTKTTCPSKRVQIAEPDFSRCKAECQNSTGGGERYDVCVNSSCYKIETDTANCKKESVQCTTFHGCYVSCTKSGTQTVYYSVKDNRTSCKKTGSLGNCG